MTEQEWTEKMANILRRELNGPSYGMCHTEVGRRIPYGYEIRSYVKDNPVSNVNRYQTDLLIFDQENEQCWKPRVIVEVKLKRISTHDAITYSQKALSHKTVHPYLRYGIMLGDRKKSALPGRLYRHGAHFDFMLSFKGTQPTRRERDRFLEIIQAEIEASRKLEKIIYDSRRPDRDRYTILHKKCV